MEKDTKWEAFFARNHRYADIINGLGCNGQQIVRAEDLEEQDGKSGKRNRDILRKAALGMNFVIVGIENQDRIDYRMPFRNMAYDVNRYSRQFSEIYREVRKDTGGLTEGEYLYGFKKNSKVHPVITFILYSGEKPWDGATSLHELIDFTDVPEGLKGMVQDYKIHVFDIRRFEHSEVFRTDVRQVFDFIRFSEDKEALLQLVEGDDSYKHMEEDAVQVVAAYTHSKELIQLMKQDEKGKGEKRDMCKAIRDLMEDSRAEGLQAGIKKGHAEGHAEGLEEGISKLILNYLSNGGTEDEAMKMLAVTKEDIEAARKAAL